MGSKTEGSEGVNERIDLAGLRDLFGLTADDNNETLILTLQV